MWASAVPRIFRSSRNIVPFPSDAHQPLRMLRGLSSIDEPRIRNTEPRRSW